MMVDLYRNLRKYRRIESNPAYSLDDDFERNASIFKRVYACIGSLKQI